MTGSDLDPDQARETAEEILSRPEFRADEPSLLDRVFEWGFERLSDLLGILAPGSGGTAIGWIILIAVVGLVAYLVLRFAPNSLGRNRVGAAEPVHQVVEGRTRDEWLAEAEEAERDGAWDRVVRARWRALVAGLVDRSRLDDDPAVTSGEHRRSFATGAETEPVMAERFEGATERYEDVWFGGRPAGPDDRDALVGHDRALLGASEEETR